MEVINSLEVSFNVDGTIANWSFNGGQRTGSRKLMKAARETLYANLSLLEMAFASRMREIAQRTEAAAKSKPRSRSGAVSRKTGEPKGRAASTSTRRKAGGKLQ